MSPEAYFSMRGKDEISNWFATILFDYADLFVNIILKAQMLYGKETFFSLLLDCSVYSGNLPYCIVYSIHIVNLRSEMFFSRSIFFHEGEG